MAFNIEIKDNTISQFSDHAKDELNELLSRYAEKIISESARIEAEQRDQNQTPDIGRGAVREASSILNRYKQKPKTKWWVFVSRFVSPISGVFSGALFKPDDFTNLPPLLLFLVSLGCFLISTTISVFLGGGND